MVQELIQRRLVQLGMIHNPGIDRLNRLLMPMVVLDILDLCNGWLRGLHGEERFVTSGILLQGLAHLVEQRDLSSVLFCPEFQ